MITTKQYIMTLLTTVVFLLGSCAGDSSVGSNMSSTQIDDSGAMAFDAYTQRATTAGTRAGLSGSISDAQLRMPAAQGGGFGVFAYHTDDNRFDERAEANLMYNQLVTYNTSADRWQYEPVKYWPNEYGSNAESKDKDKVSFFAYAPYVNVDPETGYLIDESKGADGLRTDEWGVTQLTSNRESGAPQVRYKSSLDPSRSIDLLWGVCDQPQWPVVQTGAMQTLNGGVAGLPWLNVEHPAQTAQRLKFQFRHATAQLAVSVDTYADTYDTPASVSEPDKTRIFVRSITFTGFTLQGALSLYNTTANEPLWLSYCCNELLTTGDELTIHDGRKDGKEGYIGVKFEQPQGLNPDLVQSSAWDAPTSLSPGVDGTERNLFRQWNTSQNKYEAAPLGNAIHVIPTGDPIQVTICYDVETVNPNLPGVLSDGHTHGTSIENCITKTVAFGGDNALHAGHRYELRLHLGLNSVKFDAAVSDWLAEPHPDKYLELGVEPSPWLLTDGSLADVPLERNFSGTEQFGLYAVDPATNKIVSGMSNLPVTYQSGSRSKLDLTTYRENGLYFGTHYRYFLYHPYTASPGTVNPAAATPQEFFSGLISGWTVAPDQSTEEKLWQQDLLVGVATQTGSEALMTNTYLIAPMQHAMGLAVIRMGASTSSSDETRVLDGETSTVKYSNQATSGSFYAYGDFGGVNQPLLTGLTGTVSPTSANLRAYYIVHPTGSYTFETNYKYSASSTNNSEKQWDDLTVASATSNAIASNYYRVITTAVPKWKNLGRVYTNNGNGLTTGSAQSYYLPFATSQSVYQMECWGAQGGNMVYDNKRVENKYWDGLGGLGGYVCATTKKTSAFDAGNLLYVYCGGAGTGYQGTGTNSGGWNGGGFATGGSSGGGGASDVRTAQGNWDANFATRLIVAGGGGGSNDFEDGGYGGRTGGNGISHNIGSPGLGATQSAGGTTGGTATGSLGKGGNITGDGGGGGGGYYGGGNGSGNASSGGGGSSWADPTYFSTISYLNGGDLSMPDPGKISGTRDIPADADADGNYHSGAYWLTLSPAAGNAYPSQTATERGFVRIICKPYE